MQKIKINMLVQGPVEPAVEFSQRIEEYCNQIMKDEHAMTRLPAFPPIVSLTSDGHGRQTATVQFLTSTRVKDDVVERVREAAFDRELLEKAMGEFSYSRHFNDKVPTTMEEHNEMFNFYKYLLEYQK